MWKQAKGETSEPKSPALTESPGEQLKDRPIIGPSIRIKGELGGEGDLIIQGQVEGKIDLKKSNITIGKEGCVKADIYGKIIRVEGEVHGSLFGEERIEIRQSALVRGNLTAPRIHLEDGAKFQGRRGSESDFRMLGRTAPYICQISHKSA